MKTNIIIIKYSMLHESGVINVYNIIIFSNFIYLFSNFIYLHFLFIYYTISFCSKFNLLIFQM